MGTSSNLAVRAIVRPYTWDTKEGPEERYIIIGNGFDLECGMPTSYGDYLRIIKINWDNYIMLEAHCAADRETGDFTGEFENSHAVYTRMLHSDDYCNLNPVIRYLVDPKNNVSNTSFQKVGEFYSKHKNLEASDVAIIDPEHLVETIAMERDWTKRLNSWRPLFDNFWFRFFLRQQNKKKWIDFESEIAWVIAMVERALREGTEGSGSYDDYPNWLDLEPIASVFLDIYDPHPFLSHNDDAGAMLERAKVTIPLRSYRDLRDRLLNDLDVLTKGLRRYLRDYVGKVNPDVTPAIDQIVQAVGSCEKTYVVSFNYTNTLEAILDQKGLEAEFCYVHGRVNEENERMQLVLGIDEYLSEDEASKRVEFAGFRKYNQRILRRSSSTYRDWLDRIKSTPHVRRELIIFGHSIGVTDKDVLRPFILAPNMRTVVYYHDDTAFSEKLANMTPIIGMDAVIDRTGGKNRTLVFEEQGLRDEAS